MGTTEQSTPSTENQAEEQKAAPSVEELQREVESLRKAVKDTQASYTKSRQQLKALEKENELLKSGKLKISPEKQKELDDLKYSNPEKWRQELAKIEQEQQQEIQKAIQDATLEAKIDLFKSNYPDVTPDMLQNDLPPRLIKKLEDADIDTFEDVAKEAYEYLKKTKVINPKNPDTMGQPNLNNVSGGSTPDKQNAQNEIMQKWSSLTF